MLIFDVIFVVGIVAAIVGLARITNGRRGQRDPRQRRQSWLVTAWNASGARPLEASTLRLATGELAGRATGGFARGGKRASGWLGRRTRDAAGRAGRSTAERARRRWDARHGRDERQPLLFRRERRGETPGEQQTERRRWWRRSKPQRKEPETEPEWSKWPPASDELAERRKAKVQPPPAEPPAQPAPRPSTSGETVTTPDSIEQQPENAAQIVVPPDWALLADRVSKLHPENDDALSKFMIGEMAGMLAYAQALIAAHETCVNSVGLDPSSVQGMAEYSTAAGEAARKMSGAHSRFLAVYREVRAAVAAGVKLPYRGRWFAGNAS